jgi:hypothetical protein
VSVVFLEGGGVDATVSCVSVVSSDSDVSTSTRDSDVPASWTSPLPGASSGSEDDVTTFGASP